MFFLIKKEKCPTLANAQCAVFVKICDVNLFGPSDPTKAGLNLSLKFKFFFRGGVPKAKKK